jgi:hypothetical protein
MKTLLAVLFVSLAALVAVTQGQRISDYRDPDVKHDEGWTTLFNGKDFTGLVPVIRMPDGKAKRYMEHEVGEQDTFFVKDGKLMTTGKPNGYVRTADVYDNFVFHVEVLCRLAQGH